MKKIKSLLILSTFALFVFFAFILYFLFHFFRPNLWEGAILIAALLGVVFFLLGKVSDYITKPIEILVEATHVIKQGKFQEAIFPKLGQRSDEIAELNEAFQEMAHELQEKEKIRSLLNKVVSKDIAEEIVQKGVKLGGEDRVVTIFFADIRNFTELSQSLPAQKVVRILNEVMTLISDVIEGEGGVIDKYVGDEVMAIFGAPLIYQDHAIRALSTAKLVIEKMKRFNEERKRQNERAIEIGIGINTGEVVAGNMGAENRLNYTVIGNSVNLAARLCQIARPMQIVISEFTFEQPEIKELFYVESLPDVTLKGYKNAVKNFQITGFKWG